MKMLFFLNNNNNETCNIRNLNKVSTFLSVILLMSKFSNVSKIMAPWEKQNGENWKWLSEVFSRVLEKITYTKYNFEKDMSAKNYYNKMRVI